MFGRIFYGEPASTSPENALGSILGRIFYGEPLHTFAGKCSGARRIGPILPR
jgi:hypothetical protein